LKFLSDNVKKDSIRRENCISCINHFLFKDDYRMADSVKGRIRLQILKCFCIITVIVSASSCAQNLAMQKQAEDAVGKAGQYIGAAKKVKAGEKYPDQFEKAQKDYDIAKGFLEKQKAEQAIQPAESSVKTSDGLLKQYYREEIVPNAEKLRKAIKEKVGDDIDNPLNDQISDLDGIMSRAKELEAMKGVLKPLLKTDASCFVSVSAERFEKLSGIVNFSEKNSGADAEMYGIG
jgi:hypothetical protein